jgi:competence protein ComEC
MKRKTAQFVMILFVCSALAGLSACTTTEKISAKQSIAYGDFSCHFLELGTIYTGDSIFIKAGDTDILIDAGSRQMSATTIENYVDKYCTDGKLEYVIATHAHQDHIAGFAGSSNDGIFYHYSIGTIIDFPKTNSTTSIYSKYQDARTYAISRGATHYTALQCWNHTDGAKDVYQISADVTMTILYNYFYENNSTDENNYSVCVLFSQNGKDYLFTGDLEQEGEEYLVKKNTLPHCVLFKAGHHGSYTASNDYLLSVIRPEVVCICCCAGTSEYTDSSTHQFPAQEAITRIAHYTEYIYATSVVANYVDKNKWISSGTVTSMNGNIVFSVAATGAWRVNCSNNNTVLRDTAWFKGNRYWPTSGAVP